MTYITRKGRMIVCSLHQPSFEILDMLDNIIVLDNGQTIYNVDFNKLGCR